MALDPRIPKSIHQMLVLEPSLDEVSTSKTSWQRVVRKTDPVVDLEEFRIGDTAPSADVREVVEKEFEDKPYRVAMIGTPRSGKSSFAASVTNGRHYIPTHADDRPISERATLFGVTPEVELLELPSLPPDVLSAFQTEETFTSLKKTASTTDDPKATEQLTKQQNVRRALAALREGRIAPGGRLSWTGCPHGDPWTPMPDPDPANEVQAALVFTTVREYTDEETLVVGGCKADKLRLPLKSRDGGKSVLALLVEQCHSLHQAVQTVLGVPTFVVVSGYDTMFEHVTPDVDLIVEESRSQRLRLLTKERLAYLQEYMSKGIFSVGGVFYVDASVPGSDVARGTCSQTLYRTLTEADRRQTQKACHRLKAERFAAAKTPRLDQLPAVSSGYVL